MALKDLENQIAELRSKIDTRLATQTANTKWLVIVGLVILAFMGYTNYVSIPSAAKKVAKETVTAITTPEVVKEIEETLQTIREKKAEVAKIAEELARTENSWKVKERDLESKINTIQTLKERVDKAHSRLNGLSLKVMKTADSKFDCGGEHKKEKDLWVMYGCRDGTGCGVENVNYYKELSLVVPSEK
jgi:uncharacterized protein YdaT